MILVIGVDGSLIEQTPEDIYQGSNVANKIQIIAPFSSNILMFGKFTTPMHTSDTYQFTRTIAINDEQNMWELDLPIAVTQYHGKVELQLKVMTGQQIIITTRINFMVKKGIPVELPEEPTPEVYELILSEIARINGVLENIQSGSNENDIDPGWSSDGPVSGGGGSSGGNVSF